MFRSSKKLKLLSGLICLIAAVFALDTVSFGHGMADSSQTKVLEIDFEEYISLDQRHRRRETLRRDHQFVLVPERCRRIGELSQSSVALTTSERDWLNGFGGFLRL